MPISKLTNLLNTFDLHCDPNEADKISCQEVVNYCEAQFRVILQVLSKENVIWKTNVLFRELV